MGLVIHSDLFKGRRSIQGNRHAIKQTMNTSERHIQCSMVYTSYTWHINQLITPDYIWTTCLSRNATHTSWYAYEWKFLKVHFNITKTMRTSFNNSLSLLHGTEIADRRKDVRCITAPARYWRWRSCYTVRSRKNAKKVLHAKNFESFANQHWTLFYV